MPPTAGTRLGLLGADEKHHAIFEGGHIPLLLHSMIKEILDWLDRHLGPVPSERRESRGL
jgi:hypothetical protein